MFHIEKVIRYFIYYKSKQQSYNAIYIILKIHGNICFWNSKIIRKDLNSEK